MGEWAKDLKNNEEELKKAQKKTQSMFEEIRRNTGKMYPLQREWNAYCGKYIGNDKEYGNKLRWNTFRQMESEIQKYKEEKAIKKCAELTRRREELTEQIKTALKFFKEINYRGDYPYKEILHRYY